MEKHMEQMRQVIHERTAPRPSPQDKSQTKSGANKKSASKPNTAKRKARR
jgi:hypothetical protein